jgi:FdhE protein
VCGFCWHRWPTRRRACPWCGNVDAGTLHYFAPEQEPEYRVELCDGCQHYLKTLDLRHLERPAYLPLEQVASLHLDLKAQEMGYRRFDTGRGAVAIPGAA